MSTCILNWSRDRGFELDLDAEDDEVALRLSSVAVPADGTDELMAGVSLDRLEILFKAHVDVGGEPGQLVEAVVRMSDAATLVFSARIEDMDSGEMIDFQSTHTVRLPKGVPASGGPRPQAQTEDDLDWEDEHTLEKMIVSAPETASDVPKPTPMDFDDDSDDAPAPKTPPRGLQALLKALVEVDDPEAPMHAPTEPEVDIAAILGKAAGKAAAPVPQGNQVVTAESSARAFLDLLVDRDGLEIEEGHDLDELVAGAANILEQKGSPERKAHRLSEWLLAQPAVADLFIDDDDLADILSQW